MRELNKAKEDKGTLGFAEWCVVILLLFVATAFLLYVVSSCSTEIQEEHKVEVIEVLDVQDKPAPEIEAMKPESEQEPEVIEYYEPKQYYEEQEYYEDTSYSEPDEGMLTMQGGVNYYNGRTETYYSSNVLYHYRTNEWHTDENGVWRDADGYVIVAASDIEQGELIDTSHGMGKVYDSGCSEGIIDIYVSW